MSSTSIQVTKLSRFINNAEQLAVPFKAVSDTPPSQCAVVCGKEIACIGMNHHPDMQSCELVDETGFQQRYQPNDVDWRMYMDAPRNPGSYVIRISTRQLEKKVKINVLNVFTTKVQIRASCSKHR